MSVKINWTFTSYNDVGSVVICRSPVLNNEKAFEDSLNSIAHIGDYPEILTTVNTNSLTPGLQTFTDIETLDPNTTYYYCVAAKGPNTSDLYKVGPTSSEASATVITNAGNGTSSVAAFTTGANASTADLFNVAGVKYIDALGNEVQKTSMVSDSAKMDLMITAFERGLNWLRSFISLPSGASSHNITFSLCENFPLDTPTLASATSSALYPVGGTPEMPPFTYGHAFTRDGHIKFNVPHLILDSQDEDAQMDPLQIEHFFFVVAVHELIHPLGFNSQVMDVSGTYTQGVPATSDESGDPSRYLYRGAKATKEYRRYVEAYEKGTSRETDYPHVDDIIGIPMEDSGSSSTYMSPHFEEVGSTSDGNYYLYSRLVNGRPHPVPRFSSISTAINTLRTRYDPPESTSQEDALYRAIGYLTRLELAILEDIGYVIDWAEFETHVDINPLSAGVVDVSQFPYPT